MDSKIVKAIVPSESPKIFLFVGGATGDILAAAVTTIDAEPRLLHREELVDWGKQTGSSSLTWLT
jgi:hypothetical protein